MQHAVNMAIDGAWREHEALCDLLGRGAVAEQLDDLPLARGQGAAQWSPAAGGRLATPPLQQRRHHPSGDDGLAARSTAHPAHTPTRANVPVDVPDGAR